MHAIERILAPLGRRVDEASPLCDARLPDGSRVNVVIPPLSLSRAVPDRAALPAATGFSLRDLVANGTLRAAAGRAARAVRGGARVDARQRRHRLGQDDDAERAVGRDPRRRAHRDDRGRRRAAAAPARTSCGSSRGRRTWRAAARSRSGTLVRNALRMRPDRIVVGEVRGGEALDMLQALNTGHDGSLTTVHANSPEDALRRVETLALMAGVGLPHAAVREQVASALDLVVHQARRPDGARVVRVGGRGGARRRRGRRARAVPARRSAAAPGDGALAGASPRSVRRRARARRCGGLVAATAAGARRGGAGRELARGRDFARAPACRAARARRARGASRASGSGARGATRARRAAAAAARRRRGGARGWARCWSGPRRALALAAAGPCGRGARAAGPARALPAGGRGRRCRRSAIAMADALGGGHSLRGALGGGGARPSAARPATSCGAPPPSWRPGARTEDALEAMRERGALGRGSTRSWPRACCSAGPAATWPRLLRDCAAALEDAVAAGGRGARRHRPGALHGSARRAAAAGRRAARRAGQPRLAWPGCSARS